MGPCDPGSNPGSPIQSIKTTKKEKTKMASKKMAQVGRFGTRYGKKIRVAVISIEKKQRAKQKCPYCTRMTAKRMAKGIWECKFCGKTFTGGAYFLEAKQN